MTRRRATDAAAERELLDALAAALESQPFKGFDASQVMGLILNSTYHLVGCQNDGDP